MPTSQSQDSGSECSKFFFKDFAANRFTLKLNVLSPCFVLSRRSGKKHLPMTLVCATGDRKFWCFAQYVPAFSRVCRDDHSPSFRL